MQATIASGGAFGCSTGPDLDGEDQPASTPDGSAADAGTAHDGGSPRSDGGTTRDGGVSGDGGDVDPTDDPYTYLPCSAAEPMPTLPAPLQTSPASSSLALYEGSDFGYAPIDPPPYSYAAKLTFGPALCADDDAACSQAIDAKLTAAPCDIGSAACRNLILYKQGDTLTRIQTRADLLAFFGPIDSIAEAVLLAAFDGHTIHCAQPASTDQGPRTFRGTGIYQDETAFHVQAEYEFCWQGGERELYSVQADGTIDAPVTEALSPVTCVIGRRPQGVCGAHPAPARTETAGFLAEVAELEAASVLAFAQIADELAALRAPAGMIAKSHAALCDEVRHADVMARMARRFGGRPQHPRVPRSPLRSALALACDNASEGCVRETFGALLASYQAEHAQDEALRAAFQTIAADETRHAQLSWEIAAWLEPQLSDQERTQVEAERLRAVAELAGELDLGLSSAALQALGLPSAAQSEQLFRRLRAQLWS